MHSSDNSWEYVTVPLLVHATKQILDNWGADGWELVQVVPGPNAEQLVAYLKRPRGHVSAVEDRLAELGLSLPEVAPPVAAYVPAVRTGVATSGPRASCRWSTARSPRPARSAPRSTPEQAKELAADLRAQRAGGGEVRASATCDQVVRVVKVVGFVASAPDFTGQPGVVNGASELLGAGVRRRGRARAQRGRRRGAAARRAGRGRDRRRGPLSRAAAPTCTTTRRPPSRCATPPPWCCCGRDRTARGLPAARVASMAFAAGMHGLPRRGCATRQDSDLRATAVREVLEETGVRARPEPAGTRGRAGSPPRPSRVATTPGSSWPRCPRRPSPCGVGTEMDRVAWWTPAGALAADGARRARAVAADLRDAGELGRAPTSPRCSTAATGRDLEPVVPVAASTTRRLPRRAAGRPGAAPVTEPSAAAWTGGRVTAAGHLRAGAEPGPMTLEGTNTWVLAEPGRGLAVVVDPGPDVDGAPTRRCSRPRRAGGRRVGLVLLTHGHPDHAEGAPPVRRAGRRRRSGRWTRRTGSAARASATATSWRVGGLDAAGRRRRRATPPTRCPSSLAADGAVLTGDTVLGRGTTVVAHPDGRLGDYLRVAATGCAGWPRRAG